MYKFMPHVGRFACRMPRTTQYKSNGNGWEKRLIKLTYNILNVHIILWCSVCWNKFV
jgi:hypothetical protein